MSTVEKFKELVVWQKARELVRQVYNAFHHLKDYAFKDHIQRAAVSIMNNIAEGFERSSDADFKRFLVIAKASCGEVRSMLYLAEDLNLISTDKAKDLREESRQLSAQLGSLIRYLGKQ